MMSASPVQSQRTIGADLVKRGFAAWCLSAAVTFPSAGDILDAVPPVLLDVSPARYPEIATMPRRELRVEASRLIDEVRSSIQSHDEDVLAFRLRGLPRTSQDMTDEQAQRLERVLGMSWDDAARTYDEAVATLIDFLIAEARTASAGGEFSMFGYPVESGRGGSRELRESNERFENALASLDTIVSSESFVIVGFARTEADYVRSELTFARRAADDRPIFFRTNGIWRVMGDDLDAYILPGQDVGAGGNGGDAPSLTEYAERRDQSNRGNSSNNSGGGSRDGQSGGTRSGGGGGDNGGGGQTDPRDLLADVEVQWVNNRVEMRDADDGTILIDARSLPLHITGQSDSIVPTIDLIEAQGGFDLRYRFHNDSNRERPLGQLATGIFTLGEDIKARNFRVDGSEIDCNFDADPNFGGGLFYPRSLYSPVGVISNDQYTIGLSLLYPVLEYKHDVYMRLWSPSGSNENGEGGRGWSWTIRLSKLNANDIHPTPAVLQPGESRDYVVAIRVSKRSNDWMRTLLPYRDHFYATYGGGVEYVRDPHPVGAVTFSGDWAIRDDNPYGFVQRDDLRPDLVGFGPMAAELSTRGEDWNRMMLWTPSGVFRTNENRYPFQFTSNWFTEGTQMGDAVEKLSTVPNDTLSMGLWWGMSSLVMTRWNPGPEDKHPFDVHNPSDRNLAFAELDTAAQTGATMIGLDTFALEETPMWDMYSWLLAMRSRHPEIKYITETRKPDFMNRIAATFERAFWRSPPRNWNGELEDLRRIYQPNLLADFLLPGHEHWTVVVPTDLEPYYHRDPTPEELREHAAQMAEWGYVPVFPWNTPHGQDCIARESWLETVPEDLQVPVGSDGP